MKKTLVIGSTVVDVIINLDKLPGYAEDVHVKEQTMSLGGCAFNAYSAISMFGVPAILFSPVGTGIYGRYVRENLAERGIETPIPTPNEDNGCCYCFVEADGERTFISYHGAEYKFYGEWFDALDVTEIENVYLCGLEVEEPTGEAIVEFLEKNPDLRIFFATGPRINKVPRDRMERIFALHPVIHLNESEACEYTGCTDVSEAAGVLYGKTGNTVIISLGERGAMFLDKDGRHDVPGIKAKQIDTIGAGDSHIGAIIACLSLGSSMEEAIKKANIYAAAVVEEPGALLSSERFISLSF